MTNIRQYLIVQAVNRTKLNWKVFAMDKLNMDNFLFFNQTSLSPYS